MKKTIKINKLSKAEMKKLLHFRKLLFTLYDNGSNKDIPHLADDHIEEYDGEEQNMIAVDVRGELDGLWINAHWLTEAMENSAYLIGKLILSQNDLSGDLPLKEIGKERNVKTITHLANAINKCPEIEALGLRSTRIGDEEIEILAELLCEHPRLKRLDVGINNITDEGAASLAFMLKKLATVEYLCIDNIAIGDKGIEYLVDAIKDLKNLELLDISRNLITEKGASVLLEMLEKRDNTKLKRLLIDGNPDIPQPILAGIRKCLGKDMSSNNTQKEQNRVHSRRNNRRRSGF